jgi:hypothetical protein
MEGQEVIGDALSVGSSAENFTFILPQILCPGGNIVGVIGDIARKIEYATNKNRP